MTVPRLGIVKFLKMQNVQSAVLERRLRPIYDCLDTGSFKKAVQEADKVLKKTPNLQCARALKALALLRMAREDEFEQMMSVLEREKFTDDATLQVMKFVYREIDQPLAICKMYEEAVKLDPTNEEVMSHLFMSYVQMDNFKGQQAVGMQLYKLNPKSPYYFWSVMSIILQALRGPDSADEGKRKLLFTLAQRMLDKFIADKKMDAEQEVQLYLSILQHQGKFEEALDFLQGPIGTKLYSGAPVCVKLDLLKSLKQWKEFNKIIQGLLEGETDRWDYYQDFIVSSLELIKSNDPDTSFESCHEFICHLIETSPKKVRGPFLARLELHRLMREEQADAVALLGEYSQLLLEYFRNFGDRSCCPHDLKLFGRHLSADEYQGFVQQMLEMAPLSDDGSCSTETMMKYICAVQVARFWDTTDRSKEALEAQVDKLIHLYGVYNKRFEEKLLSTDISPCDQFIVLAAQILCDLAIQTSGADYLVKAVCLLIRMHGASPSNYKAMLMTVKIFHWLGLASNANHFYEEIDPKYIQMDTLGYLHTALLSPFMWSQSYARLCYQTTTRFFTMSAKESVDYLAMSYRTGTFSKLQELLDFRDRLADSQHYHRTLVENVILEMMSIGGSPNSSNFAGVQQLRNLNINPEHRLAVDRLVDNRDLDVMIRWDPVVVNDFDDAATREKKRLVGLEYVKEQSFKEQVLLLQIRKALVNLIVAQVNGLTGQLHHGTQHRDNKSDEESSAKTAKEDFVAVLKTLRDEWIDLFRAVPELQRDHYSESYLVNRMLSQLHVIVQVPYEAFINHLSAFSLAIIGGEVAAESGSVDKLGETVVADMTALVQLVRQTIRSQDESEDPLWTYRSALEKTASVVELLSLSTLIVATLERRLPKVGKAKGGGSKKAKQQDCEGAATPATEWEQLKQAAIVNVTKCLKEQLLALETLLDSWNTMEKLVSENLITRMQALFVGSGSVPDIDKRESVLRGTFVASHGWSMTDLKAILKEKQKFIGKN